VIRAARNHQARLEAQAVDSTAQIDQLAPPPCLDDEQDEPAPAAPPADQLRQALDAIDPDALSPREALERLYELKRLAP
jgi:DNA mismatch repair protein MutS